MIEIMIAIAILAILGPALFDNPTKAYKKNLSTLKKLEAMRVAKKTEIELCSEFSKLLQWKELSKMESSKTLADETVKIDGIGPCTFRREFTYKIQNEKVRQQDGTPVRLVSIHVSIFPSDLQISKPISKKKFLLLIEKQKQLKN